MIHERIIVPFRRWHLEWMDPQHATRYAEAIAQLEGAHSWVAVVDGDPIACAGVMTQWPGRHSAWAYMSAKTGPHMRWLTREVEARLPLYKGRIDMTVRRDFPAGLRWAKILGFEIETPCLKGFGPEGEDHVGFVRFN
jgi:hypothetical protein